MSLGDAAYMQVQWVEMVYNSTDAREKERRDGNGNGNGEKCKAVCSVDETSKTGQPVMLWDSAANGLGPGRRKGAVGWVPIGLVLGMVVLCS